MPPPEAGETGGDVKLKVSLDDRDVGTGVKRMMSRFNDLARQAGKRLGQAGFGVAAAASGVMAAPVLGEGLGILRGYAEPIGREFARQTGATQENIRHEAARIAQRETIDTFGLGGISANAEQVQAVFRARERIARMRLEGQMRVQQFTDPMFPGVQDIREAARLIKESAQEMWRTIFQDRVAKFGR
jgi:hypothetical protein